MLGQWRGTYVMPERAGDSGYVAACGIPLDVCDAVVVCRCHELQVRSEVFVLVFFLVLWLLETKVPKVEVEALL